MFCVRSLVSLDALSLAVLSLIFTRLQTDTSGGRPGEPLYFRPINSSTGALTEVTTLLKGTTTIVTKEVCVRYTR